MASTGPELAGPRHGLRGLVNFYNADFGSEGIEKTIHVGPNAWIGLFAAKLANTAKEAEPLRLALDIEYWIANVVPHDKGGVAMGVRDDPFGAAWSKIYSTENNLSYYAFLTELLRSTKLEIAQRIAITQERDRVETWIVKTAYDPAGQRMLRGINPQGQDTIQALDTVTWLISTIGPRRLIARGINPYALMHDAEKIFEVTVGGARGVDAADQDEANRTYAELRSRLDESNRPTEDHHRVIWYEGLGQYILAWSTLAEYAAHTGEKDKAADCMKKAETLTREFDQAALKRYPSLSAYPYATPGKFFRYGWGSPKESDDGPAVSLIAGVWRCFVGLGFDPMAGREIGTIVHARVTMPDQIHLAERKKTGGPLRNVGRHDGGILARAKFRQLGSHHRSGAGDDSGMVGGGALSAEKETAGHWTSRRLQRKPRREENNFQILGSERCSGGVLYIGASSGP